MTLLRRRTKRIRKRDASCGDPPVTATRSKALLTVFMEIAMPILPLLPTETLRSVFVILDGAVPSATWLFSGCSSIPDPTSITSLKLCSCRRFE